VDGLATHFERASASLPLEPTCRIILPAHLPESPSLLSIIQAAGWPIWPLIVCSIVGLALVIERMVSLQTRRIAPRTLLEEAISVSQHRLPPGDIVEQLAANSALGAVLAEGFKECLRNPHCDEALLRSALENKGREVAAELQRYLGALATIASAAPLLGLLGTVVGMIEIFGAQVTQGPSSGGAANPVQLASGISIALYNTAFGLMVAIPALLFWRYFRARVDGHLLYMELSAERFLRHLLQLRGRR